MRTLSLNWEKAMVVSRWVFSWALLSFRNVCSGKKNDIFKQEWKYFQNRSPGVRFRLEPSRVRGWIFPPFIKLSSAHARKFNYLRTEDDCRHLCAAFDFVFSTLFRFSRCASVRNFYDVSIPSSTRKHPSPGRRKRSKGQWDDLGQKSIDGRRITTS